ncbi:hypothetical protein [Alkaliphilus peptidifermentans]|uniref:Signal transducing protein n=1 Tax=Alkaliphilus peptidifermentans DSM 18978 TaxID=1120976 RepID=A0A1G5KXR2_9FIRM|nr:hypothetical protein [Alkaliphilus peptidifermentans]SCZ05367.1 hypothetical protein SAMN03080606_03865 [Alkaliphilus peptidifermentans DSM 18978]
MWTVVYMANTKQDAENLQNILVEEGFLVKVKPISKSNEEGICEVLVPRSEVEEAHNILMQRGY